MRVVIFGCGPAGLVAAHAAALAGHEIRIASKGAVMSEPGGAQYLHAPIDGLSASLSPEDKITVLKSGTAEGYAMKVYGDPYHPVSWDRYERHESVSAWDLRAAYRRAVDLYGDGVEDVDIDAMNWQEVADGADLVVSTIPRPVLCQYPELHMFEYGRIRTESTPTATGAGGWYIHYNGAPEDGWYRRSAIFGWAATEWHADEPGSPGSKIIRKPTRHTCDCNNVRWLLQTGRYGRWSKNILIDDVWDEVRRAMQ